MLLLHVRRIFLWATYFHLSCLFCGLVFCWSLVNLNFLPLSSSLCVFLICFLLYCTFMSWSFLVLLIESINWFLALLLLRILGQYTLVGIWDVWMTYIKHSLFIQLLGCIVWCLRTLGIFGFTSQHFGISLEDILLSCITMFSFNKILCIS